MRGCTVFGSLSTLAEWVPVGYRVLYRSHAGAFLSDKNHFFVQLAFFRRLKDVFFFLFLILSKNERYERRSGSDRKMRHARVKVDV